MPRYIDIDGYRKLFDGEYKETKKLIEQGETHLDNLAEGFHEASQVIDRIPTADVAKEIFEDIEQLFIDGCETHYTMDPEEYYKLKNKYTCGAKMG